MEENLENIVSKQERKITNPFPTELVPTYALGTFFTVFGGVLVASGHTTTGAMSLGAGATIYGGNLAYTYIRNK